MNSNSTDPETINVFLKNFYGRKSAGTMKPIEVFTPTDQKIYNAFLVASLLITPFCICKIKDQIRKIKDPEINNSYCAISVSILNLVYFSLWYLLFLNIIFLNLIMFNVELTHHNKMFRVLWVL